MSVFPDIREEGAFYLFDPAVLKERIAFLQNALPGLSLCYAVKANPFLAPAAAEVLPRLEICSPGEEEICEAAGVTASRVISGVYKDPRFIEGLIARGEGDIFTVESAGQFSLLSSLAEKYNRRLPLLLRIGKGSQFGIDEETAEGIAAKRGNFPLLDLAGLQFFSGTQKTSLKKLAREVSALAAFAGRLKEKYGFTVRELEYGPGIPFSYFEGEDWDEAAFLSGLADILAPVREKFAVTLELGRAIAAPAGRYFTHVVDVKKTAGQHYLITDGGMHQLVYDGQFMAMKRPHLTLPGKEGEERNTSYTVCGALCSMNDILIKDMPLPEMAVGDLLCFENAGAYCAFAGMALFLSRDLPAVYLADGKGGATLLRPRIATAPFNTPYLPYHFKK